MFPLNVCLYECKEFSVHGTISSVVFQIITITAILETRPPPPPDFCLYNCKQLEFRVSSKLFTGMLFKIVVVVYLTLTDPLRIQPWSQDRRNQTKSNRKSEISRESKHKRTDKKVASKEHRRDKIKNTNKNT